MRKCRLWPGNIQEHGGRSNPSSCRSQKQHDSASRAAGANIGATTRNLAPSTGRLSFKSLLVRRGLEKRTAVATAALPPDPIAPDVSTGSPVSDAPAAAAAPAAPDAAQRKRNASAKERPAACKSTFSAPDPSPIKRPRTAIGLNKVSPATMSEERRQRTANAAQILANLHFPGEDLDIPGADGDLKNIGKGVQSTVEWAKLNFTNCRVDGALDEMHKQRMKAMMKKDLVSRR